MRKLAIAELRELALTADAIQAWLANGNDVRASDVVNLITRAQAASSALSTLVRVTR